MSRLRAAQRTMAQWAIVRCALAFIALAAIPAALGQGERVALTVGGVVRFDLTASDVVAAAACPGCGSVATAGGATAVIEIVRRDGGSTATVDVAVEGVPGRGSFTLEARFTARDGGAAAPWRTDWIALTDVRATALSLPRRRGGRALVTVTAEYRLPPTGREAPGTHLVRVQYRVRESGSSGGHDVAITVPSVLAIRAVDAAGTPSGGGLGFDLGRNPQTYVDAIVSRRPIGADDRGFDRVEIVSNAPGGYRVELTLEAIGGANAGSDGLRDRVLLDGAPLHGRVFVADGPTDGRRTLLRRDDVGLVLDGSEPAGVHRFVLDVRGVGLP